MRKRNKKKKLNINQQSFFFEDYLKTNQKFRNEKNFLINEDRIYILFFSFFFLILIFSLKIIFLSLQSSDYNQSGNNKYNLSPNQR